MTITRRELLELTARAAALPGAAAFFAAWLDAGARAQSPASNAPPEPPLLRDYRPAFFNARDFEALQAFTEILIPTDDTPGAREAHCAHFIDFVLQASTGHSPDLQARWRAALSALERAGFHDAGAGRAAMVETISAPERDRSLSHPAFDAYVLIKRQTVFAFYTSRAGIIDALDYRGNSFNAAFPACDHPEHHTL